ncbi:MAG: hypothetical protein AB2693_15875, partial [Candidatus Thiodiazotropha sp.]
NLQVLSEKKGELLVFRRPKDTFNHEMFGPCPKCLEWMLKSSLPKHQKTCSAYTDNTDKQQRPKKKELLLETDILTNRLPKEGSALLKKEVFKMMKADLVGKTAKTDLLIIILGESWLRRNISNEVKRKYYSSSRMRIAAKFLLCMRQQEAEESTMEQQDAEENAMAQPNRGRDVENQKQIWDYLRPKYYELAASAAFRISLPDADDEEDLKSPSNAINIKYDLIRMTDAKWSLSVKELDKQPTQAWTKSKHEAEEFLQLIKRNWSEKVTRLARKVLDERRLNQIQQLPQPEDLEKLSQHLQKKLTESDLDEKSATWDAYKDVIRYTQTRLMIYNKRRSGELEAIKYAFITFYM